MNRQEFSDVVRQYERFVYTICLQFVHSPETAQDLTQETFLSAYLHREDCKPESYKPWLARIAANKAKDYLKSAYYRRVQAVDSDEGPLATAIDIAPLPEQQTLSKEGAEEIRKAVLDLKEPYHQVSVLFFLQENTVEEIAKKLDHPPKTVHTQLYRARQMLQKVIQKGGHPK